MESFLREPVPPSGTKEWQDWQLRYAGLRDEDQPEAERLFLVALEHGHFAAQEAAVIGLRMIGYEAFGIGLEPELRFEVRSPDRSKHWIIAPKIQTLEASLDHERRDA